MNNRILLLLLSTALLYFPARSQTTQHIDSLAFFNLNPSFEVLLIDDYLFLSSGQIFDVSTPSSPSNVGAIPIPTPVITAYHYEAPYLFVGTGMTANFYIRDAGSLPSTSALSSLSFGQGDIFGIASKEGYVYLAAGNAGLISVDISNPSAPVAVDTLTFPGQIRDVVVNGCQAFVSGEGGVNNVDISDPTNLTLIGGYGADYVDIKNYGDTVFVTGFYGDVVSIDFHLPSTPLLLSTAYTGVQMWGIDFRDGLIYASSNAGDLYVYENTFPSMTNLAFFNGNAGQSFDVVVDDSLIVLSSLVDGVHLLKLDTISPVQQPYPEISRPCSTITAVADRLSQPSQWVPNPMRGHGKLLLSPDLNLLAPCEVKVWNMAGVQLGQWEGQAAEAVEVDGSEWASGVYWYEVVQNGVRMEVGKFVVE